MYRHVLAPIVPAIGPKQVRRTWPGRWCPVVPEFVPELPARRGPVVFYSFAQLRDVALDVQFVLLEPGDIELLTAGTALELADNVFLVVAHDPAGFLGLGGKKNLCVRRRGFSLGDNVGGRDTLCPLRHQKLAGFLAGAIDVVRVRTGIGLVIVGDVVDRMLVQEPGGDDPRRILDNFVNPFTMTEGFCSLLIREDREALPLVGFRVVGDPDEEVGVRERLLRLLELPHMPGVPPIANNCIRHHVQKEYISLLSFVRSNPLQRNLQNSPEME